MPLLLQVLLAAVVGSAVTWLLRYLSLGKHKSFPRRPLAANVLNALLYVPRLFRLSLFKHRLDLEYMLKMAERKCGCADYGGEGFKDHFRRAIDKVAAERFSPIGQIGMFNQFYSRLTARLRMERLLKAKPEISSIPVDRPIFVMGLPRTGTTFLHRLLALDPLSRYPKTWELLHPSPTSRDPDVGGAALEADMRRRIERVRAEFALVEYVAPRLNAIHETGAELPEECLFAVGMEVPLLPFAFYTLSRDDMWEHGLSLRPDEMYTRYKDVLRILSWQSPEYRGGAAPLRRWTLKAPNHLFYVKQLCGAFPDARIIWTHRHATAAVPSYCSLLRALADASLDGEIDLRMIGQNSKKIWSTAMKRAMRELDEARGKGGVKTADVLYENLVADPVGTVKDLYDQLGFTFSGEFKANLEAYVAKNRADRERMRGSKKRLHAYSAAEFGLTEEELTDEFADYHQRFGIAAPQKA